MAKRVSKAVPPEDWRKLPRKPAQLRKSRKIAFDVTEAEWEELHRLAKKAGKTFRDYVIDSALSAK